MQFTDSHIHLQDYKQKNAQQIINEMKKIGFAKIICASAHPSDWNKIAEIYSLDSDFIVPAFGVHPWYVKQVNHDWENNLIKLLQQHPCALVGECGLDDLKADYPELQNNFFDRQIDIAKRLNRPICIHALKVNDKIEKKLKYMPEKFMLHSFGGSLDFLQKILKHGGYISLCASVKKQKNHVDILKNTPNDKLLIESDGPYLSDYSEIDDFITYVAKIKNIGKLELIAQVYQNFEEFCRV